MSLQVTLTFINTIALEDGFRIVAFPYLTDRMQYILTSIVYPSTITSIALNADTISVSVIVSSQEQAQELINEAAFFLPDDVALTLGITIPEDISPVGQDYWGQEDLTLDEDTLQALRYAPGTVADYVPILVNYSIISISDNNNFRNASRFNNL